MKIDLTQNDIAIARKLAERARAQLFEHILPFWCGPALDREQGGWMAWLSNDLQADRTQPKGLIVHSRILWAFSAVHQVQPDPIFRQMAERAFDYLIDRFWDPQHGGAFWRLNDTGEVLDDSKKIYGQAFCIYALAEFHRAFNSPAALARARECFELIERHAHDGECGGYIEVCRRDWSEAGPDARLSDKDRYEKKSMNNHLHVLEAYTNLYRTSASPVVEQRLRELIQLFLHRILDPLTNHLHHFFDQEWRVRSDTYTFGHDIEASWLLCEAAEELGDPALLLQARATALRMAKIARTEGLAPDGGLFYEGKAGHVIDPGRECWPQAEAVVGFLNALELSGDAEFLKAARSVWDYVEANLVDRVHGEWFWRIHSDGQPEPNLPKVSEWKGPYHATRACLETMRRLEPFSADHSIHHHESESIRSEI
ncbi:MAG: AGE family epimerase/isomerase [Verrucomicrobiota bacterium]